MSYPWNRSSPASASGLSLVELLVAMAVSGIVLAAVMTVAIENRALVTRDQGRTEVNESLRVALDMMGTDLREAGERLPSDFPALVVVNGATGAPDTLIIRRNVIDEVLPLCGAITAGLPGPDIPVADHGATPPAGCAPLPDADADGWADNIDAWRTYRTTHGGALWAFVYDPVARQGEWFRYDGEGGASNEQLHKANADVWGRSYDVASGCRVYLVEERVYSVSGDTLQLVRDRETTPRNVTAGLQDFQIRVFFQDGTTQDAIDATTRWTTVRSVELRLTGQARLRDRTITRTLSAEFLPRNVLSN